MLRGPFAEVALYDALRATADQRSRSMERREAAFWIDRMDDGALRAAAATGLDALVMEPGVTGWRSPDARARLRRRLAEAVASGWVLVVRRERRAVVHVPEDAEEPVLGPDDAETERVDFFFDFSDGTAVRDLAYVLEDSGGAKTKGKLPKDGSVARDHASGTYTVSLADIDALAWERARVRSTEEAKLGARVTGLDDGAKGTVRVYRLYDEDEGSALATLSATVSNGRAEASWRPEAGKLAPGGRDGVALVVAELTFEDGAVWRKTEPLAVELPAVTRVEWSTASAGPDDDVTLTIRTTGFGDGARVAVSLLAHDPTGDDAKLADPPSPALSAGSATVMLSAGDGALRSRSCDVVARVTVTEGAAKAEACSRILRVHAAPASAGQTATTDAAA